MALLFALTIFSAAALLFLLEPMIGKMLLPAFGGAPAVWNVCVAFFQAVLLLAYAYAHWLTRLASVRAQLLIHLAVVALPWLVLPFSLNLDMAPRGGGGNPTWPLVALLATTAGLPFFAVANTSPLLGQWLAASRHSHAADPYYLYAASNAGSMIGLLAYPFLVEPALTLPTQAGTWAVAYAAWMLLMAICLITVWRAGSASKKQPEVATVHTSTKPAGREKLNWLILAFVPASLLLGVTAYLSTDVSPVPLIWVVPLALYLLSFVLVFSRLPSWVPRLFAVALPLLVLAQIYHLFTGHWDEKGHYSMQRLAVVHLATFFSAAMVCHGELARRRPAAVFLTQYYFWLSLGGVLGGMFNALAAPLLFKSLAEYPLAMSAACTLSPLVLWRWPRGRAFGDLFVAVSIGLVCALLLFKTLEWDSRNQIMLCLLLCLLTIGRPLSFGLSAAALFVVIGYYNDVRDKVAFRERDFYGVLQVQVDEHFHYLSHGRILHGKQRRSEDPTVRDVPLIYYYPTGPIGQVFDAPLPVMETMPPVAVVGLGVGSLAYYGQPWQEFVFYEIDPAVERIARNDTYFTYLRDSQADVRVVLGDARLSLRDGPDEHYGLIVVDAFSGDAIPIHLMTQEAMQLYLEKLAPGGVLAFHISNRFLNLAPVLGNLARESALVGLDQNEGSERISADEKAAGKSVSHWVILARRQSDFGPLAGDARWRPLAGAPELPLWTDHYTSLWGIAHWGE